MANSFNKPNLNFRFHFRKFSVRIGCRFGQPTREWVRNMPDPYSVPSHNCTSRRRLESNQPCDNVSFDNNLLCAFFCVVPSFWNPSHPLVTKFSGNPDARNMAGRLVNLGLMYEAKGGETVNRLALQFFTTTDRVLESNPDFVDRCVLMFSTYLRTCVLVMHDYMHHTWIPTHLQYLLSDAISYLSSPCVSSCQY